MAHRLRLVGPLCVVVAVGLVATMNASAAKKDACSSQVNDTATKLLPCITETDLTNHMKAFEDIAIANPGPDHHPSRNSGEPGYWKSVQYVAGLMTDAGYDVTIQPYTFLYYAYTSVPTMSEASTPSRSAITNVGINLGLLRRGVVDV